MLHCAAGQGHDDVVRILLEGGADTGVMDNRRRMVLYFAAGYASEKVFKMLLDVVDKGIFGIHDVKGQTALQLTAKGKQLVGMCMKIVAVSMEFLTQRLNRSPLLTYFLNQRYILLSILVSIGVYHGSFPFRA